MNYPIKPYLFTREPDRVFIERSEISRLRVWIDEKIEIPKLKENEVIYLEKDDGNYYLVIYQETKTLNHDYESQLTYYNKEKELYQVRMSEYKKQLAAWEEEQSKEKVEREKAEFERLKKIYG